jgi:hypothetical protein
LISPVIRVSIISLREVDMIRLAGSGTFLVPLLFLAGGAAPADPLRLEISTFLGGQASDYIEGLDLDADHGIYLAGHTTSPDFPARDSYQPSFGGSEDAFVVKLTSRGNSLIYATYLGGASTDVPWDLCVDDQYGACLAGYTLSNNFPLLSPYQAALSGVGDAFVTLISSSGSALSFSTYLGGTGFEQAFGVQHDSSGYIYVVGETDSNNFPTANPYQSTFSGGDHDCFITQFLHSGTSLY